MLGVAAMLSIVLFSVMAYHLGSVADDFALSDSLLLRDSRSLEEDLKDILKLIPLTEMQLVVNNYLKYDPQIDDTVSFIEDQKRFIARELQRMPELGHFLNLLRENGLQVDTWNAEIQEFWRTRVTFVKPDPSIAAGGLSVMIQKLLNAVPKEDLDKLLRQKAIHSDGFRRFLQILRSTDFTDLLDAVDKNIVLQRHFFWAKQEGIEITFALELLKNLYAYVTEEIR
jgi:hypothetical protein